MISSLPTAVLSCKRLQLFFIQEHSPPSMVSGAATTEDTCPSDVENVIHSRSNSLSELPISKELMADKYADLAENTIRKARQMGRNGISAFICEPFLVVPGLQILPRNYFARIYAAVKENGGVFIADENQTGLGRIGTHYWGFQKIGIIPDIVTTGVSIGNGHPMV